MLAMSEIDALAPLACDYCRKKKLRCSREKPKYANCRNWPGECEYLRQTAAKRRLVRAPISRNLPSFDSESSLESRVKLIESSIGALNSSIEELTRLIETSIARNNPHPCGATSFQKYIAPGESEESSASFRAATNETILENVDGTSNSLELSSALSVLDQASYDLARLRDDQALPGSIKDASSKLQDMSTSYVSSAVKNNKIWSEMKRHRQATNSFYIPEAPQVQEFARIFLQHLDPGYPVFVRPDMDLVPKIISEPQNVPEKAWVVIANCILTSVIAAIESPSSSLCRSLQWNTFLALDEATIFLHPSLINIRALILVA